jgi:hypothetical protein
MSGLFLTSAFLTPPREAHKVTDLKPARKDERKQVLMNAIVIDADGRQPVRVKNLTVSGVRISTARRLHVDSDVIFERGTMFVAARVVWSKPEEAGLEFYCAERAAEMRGG